MWEELSAEDARQQRPNALLAKLVVTVAGNQGRTLDEFYTGYAANLRKESAMPAHLYRALEVGLKLEKVSDSAFVTMRQLRDD